MPSQLAILDQNLPRFTGQESLEQRVALLRDYQYQMAEQLRYALQHLDTRNMNMTAMTGWADTITQPLRAAIEDNEGHLLTLEARATELAGRLSDAQGNIATFQATAQALSTTVASQGESISTLQQTAEAITTTVAGQGESISTVQQTVDGLTVTVGYGDNARTLINGGSIYTGNLYLDSLYGNSIYLMDGSYAQAACFAVTGASSYAGGALEIMTGALRMRSYGGAVYLAAAAGGAVQVHDDVQITGDLIPNSPGAYTCGSYGFPWADLYTSHGTFSDLVARVAALEGK